jgi:hypothetical protein
MKSLYRTFVLKAMAKCADFVQLCVSRSDFWPKGLRAGEKGAARAQKVGSAQAFTIPCSM